MDGAALEELFAPPGSVTLKRMFSGQGVYLDGLIFALQIGGVIYLKTNAETAQSFAQAGSAPFSCDRPGRTVITSYWSLPEACFDDEEALEYWGGLALKVAHAKAARPARRNAAQALKSKGAQRSLRKSGM